MFLALIYQTKFCLTRNRPIHFILIPKIIARRMSNRGTRLPFPQGPLATGCADLMFGSTSSGILMRLYYPTVEKNVEDFPNEWPYWFLGSEYTKGIAKFAFPNLSSLFEVLFNWQTKSAKIPSLWEAPLAKGKFPLVIFSHGLSAHRTMYSTVCNDLASHGFIVAALEHRDESACATFTLSASGEKEWIPFRTLGKNIKEFALRNSQVKLRAEECIKALDIFERIKNGETVKNELNSLFDMNSLSESLDLSQPILSGHSFGGITAMLVLSQDHRFKIGVALDPWMFPLKNELQNLRESIFQPMLIILTETFQNQPNFRALTQMNSETNTFVTIKGSVHQNQSDTPLLFGFIGRLLGHSLSKIDPRLAISLNNKLMVNFICNQLGIPSLRRDLDLDWAQKHLQIGLDLRPISRDEGLDFLHLSTRGQTETPSKL